jgi:putative glycosyltransferase (TIGR04372 family)
MNKCLDQAESPITVRKFVKALLVSGAEAYLRMTARRRRERPLRIIRSTAAFYGHLALEPENYLAVRQSQGQSSWATKVGVRGSRDWWTLGKLSDSPNSRLAHAWKRSIVVPPSWWIDSLIRAGERRPALALPAVSASLFGVGNSLDATTTQFSLSSHETRDARREMAALGVDLNRPYVALIVRDDKYFNVVGKKLSDGRMRNRSIADFAPMALALAQLGVQVIRLGHHVASELEVQHPLVFDYATSGRRSELLDIFIPLTATASVSTLTGSDALALVGRRPVLYVDIAVYAQVFHATRCSTWIPARLRDETDGRVLDISEVFARDIGWYVAPDQFSAHQIQPCKSTPAEISTYATEFVQSVLQNGCYIGDAALQDGVRVLLARVMGERGRAMHGEVRSQILDSFLRSHRDFIPSQQ